MSRELKVRQNYCLVHHNCLAAPAIAEAWARVSDLEDLQAAIELARQRDWPVLPLGSGSNLVLADRIPGLVVQIELRGIQVEERSGGKVRLRAAAGENWHELVTYAVGRGFYGIENLALIPGTLGAAPIQNIGAYGVDLEEVFVSLRAVDSRTGEMRKFSREDCQFAYRDSIFKGPLQDRYIITEVSLELSSQAAARADYPNLATYLKEHDLAITPENVYAAVCQIRRERLPHPADIPNVGSFFKNPLLGADRAAKLLQQHPDLPHWPQPDGQVKFAAAALIEAQGWKGRMRRGVGIHDRHALILVNPGHESSTTVLAFAAEVQETVHQAYGIHLQIEPRCYPD